MLGELLRELRKDHNMTQAELAAQLGLSPLTISSYECGRSLPDDETKVKIARIFGVSLDYLLGLVRTPFPYERERNCIVLPASFSQEDIERVKEYISFLQYMNEKNR